MELLNYAESMQRSLGRDYRLPPATSLQQGDWEGMGQTQKQLVGWPGLDNQVDERYESHSRLGRQLLPASRPLSSDSFDERPLPRLDAPGDSPVAQEESPRNQKRPFLKRGSRLLKSVIPKRGEKQSWVAQFRGKIAAVPKPMTDVHIDEEQFESADWGVLNAQKVSRSKVHPATRVKKAAPVKASKGEAVSRSTGSFLKAGSRGNRSASVQSNGPAKAASARPQSATARKPAPPAKQPEAPQVDDLELAEFQALERRLRSHVLEDSEPPPDTTEDLRESYQGDCEEMGDVEMRAGVEEQAFEESWEPHIEFESGEEPQNWTGEDGAYELEEAQSVRLSSEQNGSLETQDWEGRSLFRDSKQWESTDGPAKTWGPAEVEGHQVGFTTDNFQRQPVESTEPQNWRPEQAELPGRGLLSRAKASPPMPGDAAGVSALVKTIFQKEPEKPKRAARPQHGPDLGAEMGFLKEKMATLDSEIQRFKRENERMERAKQEFEARAEVLAKERATWEKRMLEEEDAWNRKRDAEAQKLKRDKRVLEQQSRALLQLPSRKARSEADELRAQIAAMEEDKRVREARWRLTVDRLKGRVDELTERCKELEGEVKGHETRWQEHEDAQRLASKAKQSVRPQSAVVRAIADPALQSTSRNHSKDSVHGGINGQNLLRESVSGRTDGQNPSRDSGPGRSDGQKERREDGAVPGGSNRGSSQKGGNEMGLSKRPQTAFELGGSYADENEIDALVRKGRELSCNGAEDWTALDQSALRVSNEWEAGANRSNGVAHKTMSNSVSVATVHAKSSLYENVHKGVAGEKGMVDSRWSETKTDKIRFEPVGAVSRNGLEGRNIERLEKQLGEELRNGSEKGLVDKLEEMENGEDELLEENVGAAGKLERVYASGKRVVVFGNGTKKEVHPSGKVCIFFTNGDVKNTHSDGRVEYYYAEVATWHTQYADGVEVFHFPNGQVEQHDPDGSKEIFFSDGAVRKVYVDGTEEEVATFE